MFYHLSIQVSREEGMVYNEKYAYLCTNHTSFLIYFLIFGKRTYKSIFYLYNFSRLAGRRVWLKMENMQPGGSFKIRGIGRTMQVS